ncbi:hypothetical protein LCGC14_0855560 [marine sediment metagenome]|uniref:Uncharacterized protein n=1 Tax=marine sediment metagenome TaxID=412755 RepID=A0A0F9P912_9ZZZZ
MSIKKVNITIVGKKGNKKDNIFNTMWDGDLGDWMEDIGGEFAGAIADDKNYDEIIMSAKGIKNERSKKNTRDTKRNRKNMEQESRS